MTLDSYLIFTDPCGFGLISGGRTKRFGDPGKSPTLLVVLFKLSSNAEH